MLSIYVNRRLFRRPDRGRPLALALLAAATAAGVVFAAPTARADTVTFSADQAVPGFVNDVAAGSGGTVWAVTSAGTFQAFGSQVGIRGFPKVAKRVAVDPGGLPWVVTFDGHIWQGHSDGTMTELPGLARDIAIGPNGVPWIIGTNSRNSSFQVWSWNGSSWNADPGSGQEIDVDANSQPLVNGSDDKIWIRNGGANSGWSQIVGRAKDIGAGNSRAGQDLWIVGTDNAPWNLTNAGGWERSPGTTTISQITVALGGAVFATDPAGEFLIGFRQP